MGIFFLPEQIQRPRVNRCHHGVTAVGKKKPLGKDHVELVGVVPEGEIRLGIPVDVEPGPDRGALYAQRNGRPGSPPF